MPCSDTSSKTSMVLTVEEWPLVLQGHCALHACRHDPRRPVCQRLGAREGCPSAAILALVLEAIAHLRARQCYCRSLLLFGLPDPPVHPHSRDDGTVLVDNDVASARPDLVDLHPVEAVLLVDRDPLIEEAPYHTGRLVQRREAIPGRTRSLLSRFRQMVRPALKSKQPGGPYLSVYVVVATFSQLRLVFL